MPNAVDIFWRLPSDRLDVATVGFGNSLLLDLRIYLHYLRAVVCPRFRAKDDLSLLVWPLRVTDSTMGSYLY